MKQEIVINDESIVEHPTELEKPPKSNNDFQGGSSGRSNNYVDSAPSKLFVGGLSWQTTTEKLKEYFGQFGNVTDVLVMKDPLTQRSRGFGFITFSNPDALDRVMKVPSHTLDGKKIDPKHATPKCKNKASKTKKIFVGGVSQETLVDDVKAYFNQFGEVEEAVMLMDQQTKRHRGFGFVTFESEEVVSRVCEIHFHSIKNKRVECKKAQPKEAVKAVPYLGKRLILNLGVMPTQVLPAAMQSMPAIATSQALAFQHVLQSQQLAASHFPGSYGKLISTASAPSLSSYRYAPYPFSSIAGGMTNLSSVLAGGLLSPIVSPPNFPTLTGTTGPIHGASPVPSDIEPSQTANPTVSTLQQLNQATDTVVAGAAGGHYPIYNLSNVDMSSFSAVDWSGMAYGLSGMYSV